jgi:predicted ester cyclase
MADNYESFLHRWFEEVWNNRREDAIDEMLDDDVVGHGLTNAEGDTIRGKEDFKNLHRTFLSTYPDLKITVEDIVTEGDKMAGRCRVSATHAGEGLGLAPTNQPVEFTGMIIVRVNDGKIVEAWNEFDFMKMFTQIGALKFNVE